ncbi:MAG TPA: transposase [Allosphingosinicella sp.]|jgi:hypothetical protein
MPRLIAAETEEQIELQEMVEALDAGPFDAEDEDCFASWGTLLRKLANNRRFLADLVMEELKGRCEGQVRNNQYSAQVILVHGRSTKYLIRANFWPAEKDSIARKSGNDAFFYGLPHDHNFSFLTVGYLGPGYWSDYYEYDYEGVVGYPGEPVDLRFVERSRLEAGKVMLYRAHKDVHRQLPPDEMSVSLNILGLSQAQDLRDQYQFDLERGQVHGILSQASTEPLLALAAKGFGGNGLDLVESFAAGHPSDRIRFAAVRALASRAATLDERLSVYDRAASTGNRFISEMSRYEAERLQRCRAWIEPDPELQPAA